MALPDNNEQTDKKSVEVHKPADKKEKLHTKVIIRRLPPSMDQETFLNQISPVPPYDYMYMVKGDASLGENSFARAYINFTNPSDIYDFKEKFDNYVFLDTAGHEFPAVVEFASFQKIPKKRNKIRIDPKCNTIESDSYYLEFVEMINKPLEPDVKPEYSYQITTENKNDTTTPLLEFLKKKRAERMRIREERREERKRKEFERKKFRDDERRKRFEEKSPNKNVKIVSSPKEKVETEVENTEAEPQPEKSKSVEKFEKDEPLKFDKTLHFKNKDKKYDDRKRDSKPKYPKKDFVEKREFRNRRDDYRERDFRHKYDDYKKDADPRVQKKVKKYSEKREERKLEALKKLEQQKDQKSTPESLDESGKSSTSIAEDKPKDIESKMEDIKCVSDKNHSESGKSEKYVENVSKCRESESLTQKRIRNKDRPTIAIYRPGMLSKRKQNDGESESKDPKKE